MRTTMMRTTGIVAAALAVALPGAALARSSDRDGDGMPNRWEAGNGLRVSQNDAARDADRDRLSNLREYRLRTDPQEADTDSDGTNDGVERRRGTNPRVADDTNDAAAAEGTESRGTRDCAKDGEESEQPQQQPQS